MSGSTTLGGATSFVLLGPLCRGCTVIRVVFSGTADTEVFCRFAGALGGSAQANTAALERGVPLIQRGFGTVGTAPGLPLLLYAASQVLFWVPLGVEVQRGAEYIVGALQVAAGAATAHWSLSAELVGVVK